MKKLNKSLIAVMILLGIIFAIVIYCNFRLDSMENVVYSIKNKISYLYEDRLEVAEEYKGMQLLEYDNSEDSYAEIYYVLYDYTTEPSFYYTLRITDELNNNLIIEDDEPQIVGGIVSSIKINKLKSKDKVNVYVYEKNSETNSINLDLKMQINLKKDLERKQKINQSSNMVYKKLGDVDFKYIDSKNVYFGDTSHSYSTKLKGESCSLPMKAQYGEYLIEEEHIQFSYDKNVNNLNLEQAFESLVLINNNYGQYGLSDLYGMDTVDDNGVINDIIIINFEEMMKLCNGQNIEKNGKIYTSKSFNGFEKMKLVKDEVVKIGKNIEAIKYHFESDIGYENYMFIHNDNIYSLKVPTKERIKNEVQEFLDNLEI